MLDLLELVVRFRALIGQAKLDSASIDLAETCLEIVHRRGRHSEDSIRLGYDDRGTSDDEPIMLDVIVVLSLLCVRPRTSHSIARRGHDLCLISQPLSVRTRQPGRGSAMDICCVPIIA